MSDRERIQQGAGNLVAGARSALENVIALGLGGTPHLPFQQDTQGAHSIL